MNLPAACLEDWNSLPIEHGAAPEVPSGARAPWDVRGALLGARLRESKIVIVDGDASGGPSSTAPLESLLRSEGFTRLRSTASTHQALETMCEWRPDIVIFAVSRPSAYSFAFLRRFQAQEIEEDSPPLLMISSDHAEAVRSRALRSGAHDFLTRPCDAVELLLRVRNLLQARFDVLALREQNQALEERVRERTLQLRCQSIEIEQLQRELREARIEVIVRLAMAAELHDAHTGEHTRRVGLIAALIANALGMEPRRIEMLRRAALLHDVGKIGVSAPILLKTSRLSPEEWEEMKAHCRIGAQVLADGHAELAQLAQQIALYHHEKWDGSGYPCGLSGEQIPLEARIVAVADVFDALTHERPYKHAWTVEEAVAEICSQSGIGFDPQVVRAFEHLPVHRLV
jgi:putative two-component system response regulator